MKNFVKRTFRWCSSGERPLFIVPLGILLITLIYLLLFPANTNWGIEKSDILSFWGDYLSFAGAFCLGYFLYLQDKNRTTKEKRIRVKNLLDDIERTYNDWMIMTVFSPSIFSSPQEKSEERPDIFHRIEYNRNWRDDYYEYESIKGENADLKKTIENFFRSIDRVNIKVSQNDISSVAEAYQRYMNTNIYYCCEGYSYLDAIRMLSSVAKESNNEVFQAFFQRESIKRDVSQFNEKLFPVVEEYIYNRIIENAGNPLDDVVQVQRDAVDWICEHKEKFQQYTKEDVEKKRVISRVVYLCSNRLHAESNKVDYYDDDDLNEFYFLRGK